MKRKASDTSYAPMRLNARNEDSWAVVGLPSGAIALGARGELLFKLSKARAQELVDAMNVEQTDAARPRLAIAC